VFFGKQSSGKIRKFRSRFRTFPVGRERSGQAGIFGRFPHWTSRPVTGYRSQDHLTFPMPYTYDYPHPAVTVDCVLFGCSGGRLSVLLIERKSPPFAGHWALPGGFAEETEALGQAAARELEEETGVSNVPLVQFQAFGNPGRDPRGWTVSIAHFALVNPKHCPVRASSDAKSVQWFPFHRMPALAFDHAEIVLAARAALRSRFKTDPAAARRLLEPFPAASRAKLRAMLSAGPGK